MLRLFLSYASEDYELAKELTTALDRPGVSVWMDDDLTLGREWNREIDTKLPQSDFVLLLLTRNTEAAAADRFVLKEWRMAVDNEKALIPVWSEPCDLPTGLGASYEAGIKRYQGSQLYPDREPAMRDLIRFVHAEAHPGKFVETFSSLGPDNEGWNLGRWELAPPSPSGSGAIGTEVKLSTTEMLPQRVTERAEVTLDIPAGATTLSYDVQAKMSQMMGEAALIVELGGEEIDRVDQDTSSPTGWDRRQVRVEGWAGRRAGLAFTAVAGSRMNYFSSVDARLRRITVE